MSPRAGKASLLWIVTPAVGEGFNAFFLALSCSPLAAAYPKLAAAEGKQDIALHPMLCVLRAHRACSIHLFAAGIGLRAFYGALRPMPAMLSAY